MTSESTNELEMSAYIDIVESFFDKQYPKLEKDKFWKWFLLMMTGKEQGINELSPEELNVLLVRLKELGAVLHDPKIYAGIIKARTH